MNASVSVDYALDDNGHFVIDHYNFSKPFSNFFPGIAGLWGIPMWVFYVNRGQGIASFGIESKDKAIMEFQPANKSYRWTALQGFRTFIKVTAGPKTHYWEPFQNYLPGTDFAKTQRLMISAHDLALVETNRELKLEARVNYFTMPEEPYAAIVRRVTVVNLGRRPYTIEIIDGLPVIVPYGLKDWLGKNMSRTVEAWVRVRNLGKKAPFYQLNVEVADTPQVTHIREGNFFFSFDPHAKEARLLDPIVEASCVFGASQDFVAPIRFLEPKFQWPSLKNQKTSNRMPSAFSHTRYSLKPHQEKEIVSLFGYAWDVQRLNNIARQARQPGFVERKAQRNKAIIDGIRNLASMRSSSNELDLYATHTFLDNILRGGLPVSVKTGEGCVTFNVYSRKHGDLERDYNFFLVPPTFYSQGNGNYRDVNQNRRNDVWFNTDVRDSHVVNFLNLSQADGYNPLIVKGTTLAVTDSHRLNEILRECVKDAGESLKDFLVKDFSPGALLEYMDRQSIPLKISPREFLGLVLEICHVQEGADPGEGFWTDHWTYNLDLIESYLALYPEDLRGLLLERKAFHFYQNTHYIVPRTQRYVLTDKGVRQYKSVADSPHGPKMTERENLLRTRKGEGGIYCTHLLCKLLCLIANKIASLDPSGMGVEMEADKPNWYDALNGLPGLLGSSMNETFEIQRMSRFLLGAFQQLDLKNEEEVWIFDELADFITGLRQVLSLETDVLGYWSKSNDLKEHYRRQIRSSIDGGERSLPAAEIRGFLELVIAKTQRAVELAHDKEEVLVTYFFHEVVSHEPLQENGKPTGYVWPLRFERHNLPPFLEGYVHALRVAESPVEAQKLYHDLRRSGLYDKKLKMYRVNADLSRESEEIGRTRIFPAGWLENGSIWLHMEYKLMLELLRCGLYDEFYENFRHVFIPFLRPDQYGRSILENSSFLVSSVHEDSALHGQGFVARLSGSTAEFLSLWLCMNAGRHPFAFTSSEGLSLTLAPILAGWLFTAKASTLNYSRTSDGLEKIPLPANVYAFNLLGDVLVVYHNPGRRDTYRTNIREIRLTYPGTAQTVVIACATIPAPYASDIRDRQVRRVDVYFE
jgi:hypothetical protein